MMEHLIKNPGPVTLVYLLSASHSGSTLLAMLLGSHPEICTVGELKATSLGDVSRYRCSCRQLILECPFWDGIRDDMANYGHKFVVGDGGTNYSSVPSRYARKLLRPLHRGPILELIRDLALSLSPTWRRSRQETTTRNLALLQCVSNRTGNRVIVDSSKIGIRLKYLIRIPSLDIRIVRLIRDGRGVALTYMNSSEFADAREESLRGGGMGTREIGPRMTMEQAAREWKRSNEEANEILKLVPPSRQIQVRYEDLCGNPKNELEKLFRFIGVTPDDVSGRFKQIEHHVIGNGMRLDTTSEIRLDDRWRTILSDGEKQAFQRIGGNLNRSFGYPEA